MLLGLEIPILPRKTIEGLFRIPLFLLLCMTRGSRKRQNKMTVAYPSMTSTRRRKPKEAWTK